MATDPEDPEECDSCRINFGAGVMINLCDSLDCFKDKIDCQGLVEDFKNKKLTADQIIEKVSQTAKEINDPIINDLVANIKQRIYKNKSN